MRQSELFSKTQKKAPKDEQSKNASLLIRAGFVHKEMAGVYSFLPLGLKVVNKIAGIIRDEIKELGAEEILLSSLQDKTIWEKSGRWSDEKMDNWFKTNLKNKNEVGLASTHEEPLTNLLTQHISSHKNLPFSVFQIQTKFRNELRAKSGLMRTREFLMKDLYSFSKDESEHQEFYERVKKSYSKIFKKVGLKNFCLTFASGGSFSKYSHEFQVITQAGEDTIFVDKNKNIAINSEVMSPEALSDLGLKKEDLKEEKSVEIGNIFTLGQRFSEALNLNYLDKNGSKRSVFMGSYGIGLGRLMGVVAENLSDEKGLVWPSSISPFAIHLVQVTDDKKSKMEAEKIYKNLLKENIEVLYDDRDISAGEKFSDSDLLGISFRAVVGRKTSESGEIEVKERTSGKTKNIKFKDLIKICRND